MFESHGRRWSERGATCGSWLSAARRTCVLGLVVSMAAMFVIGGGAARGQECAGDCEGSDSVSINELIELRRHRAGKRGASGRCDACDVDGRHAGVDRRARRGRQCGAEWLSRPLPLRAPWRTSSFHQTGAMDWGDVPFPSDLYRDENGAIRIGALADGEGRHAAAVRDARSSAAARRILRDLQRLFPDRWRDRCRHAAGERRGRCRRCGGAGRRRRPIA